MSRICPKCGCANPDGAEVCSRCGALLTSADRKGKKGAHGGALYGAEPPEKKEGENGETENKISAEWKGGNCRCDYGSALPPETEQRAPFVTANGTPYYRSPLPVQPAPADMRDHVRGRAERASARRSFSLRRNLFILAFVGLLLDFWCGVGALLCLPAAIGATVLAAKRKREGRPVGTQLVWAAVVGYLGGVLGIVFFILMV